MKNKVAFIMILALVLLVTNISACSTEPTQTNTPAPTPSPTPSRLPEPKTKEPVAPEVKPTLLSYEVNAYVKQIKGTETKSTRVI